MLREYTHRGTQGNPKLLIQRESVTTITTTVTVTTSLPLYMYTPLTLIAKRDAGESEQIVPSPTPPPGANAAQHLDERAVTTTSSPWSPSSCTQAPIAASSGCSCFFQVSFATSTATVTKEAPVPTQCDAAHDYGLITDGFGILDPPGYYQHYYSFDVGDLPGGCCARCWGQPGCVAFSGGNPTGGGYCDIWILANGTPQPQDSLCPSGTVPVDLTQPTPTNGYDGLGPCGYRYN